jgi:hypothetical protein
MVIEAEKSYNRLSAGGNTEILVVWLSSHLQMEEPGKLMV